MPEFGRGTGGLVDDQVRVECTSLDEGVPVILWEDARGVRIAVDPEQGLEAVARGLAAVLADRFARGAWKRGEAALFRLEDGPPR